MNREEALDVALGQIERQFGKGSVMRMSDAAQVSVGAVSTGSLSSMNAQMPPRRCASAIA